MVIKNTNLKQQENAYYLDFQFNRHYLVQILHNVKVEYYDTSIICDHLLITPKGVTILNILSFEGVLTINEDNTLKVDYGNYYKTLSNPVKQNMDKAKVVKSYLNNRLKSHFINEIEVDCKVLVDANTYITNKTLPKGFERDIDYIKNKIIEVEQSCIVESFSDMSRLLCNEQRTQIANLFLTDGIALNSRKNINVDLSPIATYSKIV